MKTGHKITKELVIKVLATLLILLSFAFNLYQFWLLKKENTSLLSTISKFETALSISQTRLSSTTVEKLAVVSSLEKERENTYLFQNQIQNLTGTVGVLEKLSQTDTELLKKYSKIYFLNENYIPPKLVTIPSQYVFEKNKNIEIHEKVWPHLGAMLESALADGIKIQIASGYRSFGTQADLKSTYKVVYGAGTANKFSADQGYSEHQLGTTLDFTTPEIGGNLVGFDKTKAYAWLIENGHKYGFTLSYPKNNTYYIFEPWHFRFVGIPLATSLHNDKLNFYDLDQRVIDSYLINFFD
ncbi:MAG: D-alanyl-D-alanine carboxypeptidase [Parcubacteria bacterium C7867-003]|nr:MAG: D-alanyl-D-alanine carboxypeptidase [Parcubacteria bacterium C7867-003]